jgi:phospholipid/cholesterol/gamma-HCH transport system substrate-binding protein
MQNRTLEIGVGLFLLAGILALLLLALRVSGLSASPSTTPINFMPTSTISPV